MDEKIPRMSLSNALYAIRSSGMRVSSRAVPDAVIGHDGPSLISAKPEDFLGRGGRFEKEVKGFVPRDGQLKLAKDVAKAISDGTLLIAEAGTGTGKTFAYLLPALLSGKCTVISTASKALQDQLINKDLPRLSALLRSGSVKYMALKGFGNYLCIKRLIDRCDKLNVPSGEMGIDGAIQGQLSLPDDGADQKRSAEYKTIARLVAIKVAAEREINDGTQNCSFAEINSLFPQDVVSEFNCDRNQCSGHKCPYRDRCFALAARRKAINCNVLVINHALFFADAQIDDPFESQKPCIMLPKYKAIVFDEAHELPEAGRNHLGEEVSYRGLRQLCEVLNQVVKQNPELDLNETSKGTARVMEAAKALTPFLRKKGDGTHDFFEYRFDDYDENEKDPLHVYKVQNDEFRNLMAELYLKIKALSKHVEDIKAADDEALGSILGQVKEALHAIGGLMTLNSPDSELRGGYVGSVAVSAHGFTMRLTPLEISGFMGQYLKKCASSSIGVVMTSATLSVAGEFGKFRRDIGAPSDGTLELRVDSPFDYASHAALLVSRGFPDPSDRNRDDRIFDELDPVIRATDGGIFYLTTSVSALERATQILTARYGMERLILAQNQGQLSNTRLLEEFRRNGRAILIGTSSFWAGVDVQGRALSLVIIDKLPFAAPGDPVNRARCNLYDSKAGKSKAHFMGISVPEAVIELRQGVGRLIRHENDRGALVICDPRIVSKSYGAVFMRSLPPVKIFSKVSELKSFISVIPGSEISK